MIAATMHATSRTRSRAATATAALGCLALLISLLLCGCAPQRQWTGRGITQAAFDQDAARCRREAARSAYQDPFAAGQGQGLEHTTAQERIFEQCMFARGYRLSEEPAGR